jgi:3-dehydroquinate synthetase
MYEQQSHSHCVLYVVCCVLLACPRRQEPIIAIGGGVCLDVAGLAANLYRRNTGIIKVGTGPCLCNVRACVRLVRGEKHAMRFGDLLMCWGSGHV